MERLEKKYFSYSLYNPSIHLVQIHNEKPLNEIFEEYIEFSDRSAKEMKGAMILDVSKRKPLSPKQRLKLSRVINSNTQAIAKNWTSIAYVNTSMLARLILKGKLWMKPMPVKAKVFTSFEDAVTWSYEVFLRNDEE